MVMESGKKISTWSSLRERILSRTCPISTKFVKPPVSADDSKSLT